VTPSPNQKPLVTFGWVFATLLASLPLLSRTPFFNSNYCFWFLACQDKEDLHCFGEEVVKTHTVLDEELIFCYGHWVTRM